MQFKTLKVTDLRKTLPRNSKRAWAKRSLKKVKIIAIHHTAGTVLPDKYNEIEQTYIYARYHRDKNWGSARYPAYAPTLAYHFMIGRSGEIFFCNDLENVTWHANYANPIAISICLHGHLTKQEPSYEQLKSLQKLLKELTEQHPEFPASRKDVYGHMELVGKSLARKYWIWRDFGNYTTCPASATKYVQEFRNTGKISKVQKEKEKKDDVPNTIGEFTDILEDQWYTRYVKTMLNTGIMRGYENKEWRPAESITRAEMAKIATGIALKLHDIVKEHQRLKKSS
jgi:hypothetical protein